MTDHDALARRIAERLAFDWFIRQPSGMSGLETMLMVEQCIANVLREALPTSEDAAVDGIADDTAAVQAGRVIFTKSIDVSNLERAKPILSDRDVEDEQSIKETTIRGIGPDGKPMNFRLAVGRMFENVCPDCGETNGGGIDSEQSREWRQHDKYHPCNTPCMYCGKGPMNVVFISDEYEQYARDILNSASKNQNYESKCEWMQQDSIFGTDWVTECGKEFRIDEGLPIENGMKFCCFCGKKLIDVPFDEPEDEES